MTDQHHAASVERSSAGGLACNEIHHSVLSKDLKFWWKLTLDFVASVILRWYCTFFQQYFQKWENLKLEEVVIEYCYVCVLLNTWRLRRNGQHFADNTLKHIFFNEHDECIWILNEISLNFVPKGPINNIPALVHIKAWRLPGDKPLSETMMGSLPTRICVTWPQELTINHHQFWQCSY